MHALTKAQGDVVDWRMDATDITFSDGAGEVWWASNGGLASFSLQLEPLWWLWYG